MAGGPDFYGEEELLEGPAKHLWDQGVEETAAQAQLARLKATDYHLDPTPTANLTEEAWVLGDNPPRADEDDADKDDGEPGESDWG